MTWLEGNAPNNAYIYFLLAFYSGMRTGELLALDWSAYHGDSFSVDKARVRGVLKTTKTDVARTVLLPEFLCKEINGMATRFKKGALFLNQYGQPYKSAHHLNKRFGAAHEATGIRHRDGPYPWRHTYASVGLTNGAEPSFLAKQLGHSKAVLFTVYAEWISSDQDWKQVEKIL